MPTDPRFLAESGREVFIGNEMLVKGCLETEGGVNLLTGYPGSPVAGFFDSLGDIGSLLKEKGMRAFQANNEALAVAAINGSQMAACKAIAAMKSVGVHVASDALALGNLAGANPQGGAVIIMGDDPWCDSTQVPADSRFLCEHLRMAVVEPGTPQECKDWINLCFKLSQAAGLYVGYIITTAQADGGGSVDCRPNAFPALNMKDRVVLNTAELPLDKVLLPPRTWRQELKMPERHAATVQRARELGLNRIIPAMRNSQLASRNPLGFITTGMGRPYLEHVLADLGLAGQFPILNMGMSYPVDAELLKDFSVLCDRMIVIEERRSFLEKNLRDALFHHLDHDEASNLSGRLFG
ncbi:MAG: indolepyruvate ferredoxin oxidoreductase, partial [Phycisphaerae bacterium]|nr:indolepyruvate ferredoxin oxidoreductase [Phycisphaerae bacterium]